MTISGIPHADVLAAIKLHRSPVFMAGDIAHAINPWYGQKTRNPIYETIYRRLCDLEKQGYLCSYPTPMNQRVWWLKERLR